MENENKNQSTVTPQAGSPSGDLQAYMSAMRRKRNRNIFMGIIVAACLGFVGYFAYKNPQFFKAEITEIPGAPSGTEQLYIPSYNAGAGDTGTISIKSNVNFVNNFDAIWFTLNYSPSDALSFESDPFVLSGTEMTSATLKLADNSVPGKLSVFIVSSSPILPGMNETIFKISTTVNPDITGEEIELSVEDLQVMNGGVELTDIDTMTTGTITVGGGDELKVLNAEAIDSTHVTVRFSDYLEDAGNANYYRIYENDGGSFGDELEVTDFELNTDQQSVKLETATQTAGTSYIVVATGDVITGNTQGNLHEDYDAALFYGYGQSSSALSNFGMVSAAATDYKTVVVTFTDAVKADSVSATDFTVADMTNVTTPNPISVSNAVASGNTVTLTITSAACSTYGAPTCDDSVPANVCCDEVPGCNWGTSCTGIPTRGLLMKKNTYLIKTAASNSVLRNTDSAPMGISTVAFNGKDNGPILQGATITSSGEETPEYTLQLAFAPSTDTIIYGGVENNPVGNLYVEGATGSTLINELSDYNQVISSNKITLKNPIFGDPTKFFTFTISENSWIKNALGVPADESFKTISFWGYGHVGSPTIGDVVIKNKNTIQVTAGSLAFSSITSNDQISVVYENPSGSDLQTQAVSSFNVDVDGKLNIVFSSKLEPNRSYVLRLKQSGNIVVSKRFYLDQTLSVTSATATDENKISVGFSESIDATTVQLEDFSVKTIAGTAFALSSMQINETDYQHVILTTTSDLSPAAVYYVNATSDSTDPVEPIYAYSGKAIGKSIAAFGGYGTSAAQSTAKVQSMDVISSNTLRINFTAPVSQTTVTPVNVDIVSADASVTCSPCGGVAPSSCEVYSDESTCDLAGCTWDDPSCEDAIGAPKECNDYANEDDCEVISGCDWCNDKTLALTNLTITNVVQIDSDTYEFTTSKQDAGTNYFVVMDGVQDASSLLLGNAKVPNFFGFELATPQVTSVEPNTITNDVDQTVVINGQNLGAIESVSVGTQDVTIVSKSATSITITVPAGIEAKTYNITLTDSESVSKTFTNSLFVNEPVMETYIESLAIPAGVKNDGEMSTTLHVCLHGPDLASITSVIVNLLQIGGSSAQIMAEDTTPQSDNTQCYSYVVASVPNTVDTSTTPYSLPVEAHRGDEVITGTVSVMVTNDILGSVPPVINSAYTIPASVAPDGETTVKISAQVTDMDGADSIASVIANMGALGVPVVLSAIEAGTGAELTTRFYQSEEFTVPTNTATGAYTINLTASDLTGESVTQPLTLNVSTQLTGPTISTTKSYITRKSIPNDGKTEFALYVHVTDPDGVSDVTNVTASFGDMGIAPATLIKDPNAAETAKSAFFSVTGLKIPKTTPLGVKSIEITAEDSTGGLSNYVIQIDVTSKDLLGDAPMIIEDKGYTNPKVAINDGTTPITLYVFVRDDDDNLESVVANLNQVGQVGPETPADFAETDSSGTVAAPTSGEGCSTGSNIMVCMTPSLKEGTAGQWFILSGVTISTSTMPSSEPYVIDIIATDATGKVSHGDLLVSVNDGESFTNDKLPPKIVAAVPTANNKIEVLFNEEISANSVSSSGAEFTVTDKDDVNEQLGIVSATINAAGNIVTLTTDTQTADKEYALTATSDIKDAVGVSLVSGSSNKKFFNGFKAKNKVPVVDYVTATDIDIVEIEFQDAIKPSSVKLSSDTGGDPNFQIFESDTGNELEVLDIGFGNSSNVIILTTANQKSDYKYRVQINGVESYDGKKSTGASKAFKSLNIRTIQRQAAGNIGDFDGNGSVDFSDFTIFSSVYGMSYYQNGGSSEEAAPETGGQPLTPTPDALVPITSEPLGGDIAEE